MCLRKLSDFTNSQRVSQACWRSINTVYVKLSLYLGVGLWRSWERASMAWKRSTVRTRPGPPEFLLPPFRTASNPDAPKGLPLGTSILVNCHGATHVLGTDCETNRVKGEQL